MAECHLCVRLLMLCLRGIARGLGLGLGTLGRLEGEVEEAALSCILSVLLPSCSGTSVDLLFIYLFIKINKSRFKCWIPGRPRFFGAASTHS